MKNKFLLLLIISFPAVCYSQNKNLTIEDAVLNIKTSLAPKKLSSLQWIKGADAYSYVDSSRILKIDGVVSKDFKKSVNVALLNQKFKLLSMDTLASFPAVAWENKSAFSFQFAKKLWLYNISLDSLKIVTDRNFPANAENQDENQITKNVAYTIENNLFVMKDGKSIAITNDKDINIVNGKSVHREEFGIVKGTFWSTFGNYLAFYRMDQTMVTDYPIVDINQRPAKVNLIKYPMAGDKSHEVTVGIYDVKQNKTIFLQTGLPAEQYLTNIAWSPDEKHVYIAVLNRDQNEMKFNSYNSVSGAFEKTLFTETDPAYVQPLHPMEFVNKNPGQFIWQSRRDGFNHLYLYDVNGNLIRQLTTGPWEVTSFNDFDESGKHAFFTCTASGPLNRDFYSVEINTGTMFRITSNNGTHTATVSESGNYVIDNFSDSVTPRIVSIYDTKGKVVRGLVKAPDPLKEYKLGKVKLFTIKNSTGTELYCRQYFPVGFDSTKKYPVIYYLYGGPNVQLITNSWQVGGDLWYQYMAEHGYIIFTLDNRGTANRGKDFEKVIFRNLGTPELEDHLQGINYLKSLKYVDEKRMGIFGWSYGGFLTTSMMTRYPDIFKVAVAGGPVIDWSYYEVMYTERYMDTPQTNKEGYDKSNVLKYADKLKGKMLIIHGTSDPVVMWQNSLMFIKKCVDKQIPIDYFVYPGHEHNVTGKDRMHLMNKISDYFESNL
jgi:dipeptidyl-peptidase-4